VHKRYLDKYNMDKKLLAKLGEKTRLAKAQSKSDSIRSTIPSGIATHLKLNEGDWIDWSLEIVKNELVAVVRKIEQEK
jgi:hypothetical protein